MDATTLRNLYLNFFREHGHVVIGSAPLIPDHDPSVLFTTAGMHPLVPFLLGEPHPAGKRLANVQKCLRTNDILEVGDSVHLTFFEMLGNWSLGDYWKQQAIRLNYILLTERLGLEPERETISKWGQRRATRFRYNLRVVLVSLPCLLSTAPWPAVSALRGAVCPPPTPLLSTSSASGSTASAR